MAADPQAALVALNRFGLGARPGDLAAAAADPRGFLAQEMAKPDVALIALTPDLAPTKTNLQAMFADQEQKRLQRLAAAQTQPPQDNKMASASPAPGAMQPPSNAAPANSASAQPKPDTPPANPTTMQMQAGAAAMTPPSAGAAPMMAPSSDAKPKPPEPPIEQKIFRAEALARFAQQIAADAGFAERMVAFWSNHFAVSVAKGQFVRVAAGSFEREAIRPYVFGRFADMLKAVEQHPTMLFYLDNQQSIGPNSKAGQSQHKGLNENLARETMELHTLGVGGGYSQADVTSLAAMITGWTFAGREGRIGEPGTFAFIPNWHEPGPKILLGKSYDQDGLAQGEAALSDLARHPSTATHIATKLARHFVADNPPPALVAKLAKAFHDSDGDLKIVSAALIEDDGAWKAPLTKIRNPSDFLIAAARALDYKASDPNPILGGLNALGMGLWQPPGPNGYPDVSEAWASPEAMKVRLDISWQIAQRVRDMGNPLSVLDTAAGLATSRETREAISRAETRQQALAILFMSPEFQRR
ncbi:DUF1800 domain-containing protein [Methylovirgula sp. 4M-Z18]|uniref:DUF1800 domain-containing protein n=1 Tax=Methylovirgula sp. 4M-Z18 TaxID=2293567 RepID=UPI000E2E9FC1|nr:DUF1800 family protein [Methylovirgula sp. 4M-Z18]RFB81624.1 DUF1800 family protein [Methylovirgula sp. 4M-Z18]